MVKSNNDQQNDNNFSYSIRINHNTKETGLSFKVDSCHDGAVENTLDDRIPAIIQPIKGERKDSNDAPSTLNEVNKSIALGKNNLNLYINNLCGNKNKVQFPSPDLSIREGSLSDLNDDTVSKIIDAIIKLSEKELKCIPNITIPIYIIRINNILTTGKKNVATIEE